MNMAIGNLLKHTSMNDPRPTSVTEFAPNVQRNYIRIWFRRTITLRPKKKFVEMTTVTTETFHHR